jgi:intracellular multiplication protein IcmL
MRNQSAAINRRLSDPEFTQALLRRSFLVHGIQSLATIGLIGDIAWRDANPPRPHYFYTDGNGAPREVYPLDYPVMSDADVAVWTVNSVVAAYTIDFANYRDQLSSASQHFTIAAWRSFGTAFINSGNFEKLKEARLVSSAQPERAALIVHKAIIGDRLTWEIQFPMLVTYENENETNTEHLMVTVLIVRTSETDHPDGIAIEQLNAPPTSSS